MLLIFITYLWTNIFSILTYDTGYTIKKDGNPYSFSISNVNHASRLSKIPICVRMAPLLHMQRTTTYYTTITIHPSQFSATNTHTTLHTTQRLIVTISQFTFRRCIDQSFLNTLCSLHITGAGLKFNLNVKGPFLTHIAPRGGFWHDGKLVAVRNSNRFCVNCC